VGDESAGRCVESSSPMNNAFAANTSSPTSWRAHSQRRVWGAAIYGRSCALDVFCVPNSFCVERLDKFTEQVLDFAQASLGGLVMNLNA
jgi:hypothetical protein